MSSLPDNFVFDFDAWAELAQKAPEAFDVRKKELMQKVISEAPETQRQRLEGLQWRIDNEVRMSKSPLEGCLKIHRMMMAKVYDDGGLLDQLNRLAAVFEERAEPLMSPETTPSNIQQPTVIDLSLYRKG